MSDACKAFYSSQFSLPYLRTPWCKDVHYFYTCFTDEGTEVSVIVVASPQSLSPSQVTSKFQELPTSTAITLRFL